MARLFGAVLAGTWLIAWWSLGIQILALYGRDGLLPAHDFFVDALARGTPTAAQAPSVLWLAHGDRSMLALVVGGLAAASASLLGLWPRRALALCAALYMSVAAIGGPFFPMLGDKLLLEATLVALVLPRDGPSVWAHWLARLLVVKFYLHVGASQWLAPHHDWQSGAALSNFFATTPLPTVLGWWACHLPAGALSLGTKLAVLIELFAPFCLLGPRLLRLAAAAALTLLQVAALVLVNYGLFAFVAVALHLFFLEERDVDAMIHDLQRVSPTVGGFVARTFRGPLPNAAGPLISPALQALHALVLGLYAALGLTSFWEARGRFTALTDGLAPVHEVLTRWQLVHAYTHLQSPAEQRAEPLFERLVQDQWQAVDLWRQPGDLWRAPSFVAPHLPRLDVALSAWGQALYADYARALAADGDSAAAGSPGTAASPAPAAGLLLRGPLPAFVERMATALCEPHPAFSRLLRTPIGKPASAVRLSLYRYDVAKVVVHEQAGLWWTRAQVAELATVDCAERRARTAKRSATAPGP